MPLFGILYFLLWKLLPLLAFWLSLVLPETLRDRERRRERVLFLSEREWPISLSSSLNYISDLKLRKKACVFRVFCLKNMMCYVFKSFWKYINGGLPRIRLGKLQFLSYIICQLLSYYCSISDFPFIQIMQIKKISYWNRNHFTTNCYYLIVQPFGSKSECKVVVFKWGFAWMEGTSSDF